MNLTLIEILILLLALILAGMGIPAYYLKDTLSELEKNNKEKERCDL